jgi:hypothetical protein
MLEKGTPHFNVYLDVIGLKKRARSIKSHSFKLGYFTLDVSDDKLKEKALNVLNAEMKNHSSAKIKCHYVTIENDDSHRFGPIVHWAPFDETTKQKSKVIDL